MRPYRKDHKRCCRSISGNTRLIKKINGVKLGKKELSLAMTEEVSKHELKVLPAKIDDCELPALLSDKLYADFTHGYYNGMRRLLESISPETYKRYRRSFYRKQSSEILADEFNNLLNGANTSKLYDWLSNNSYVLAGLLGRLRSVSEAIRDFKLDEGNSINFMVVNGQSFRYEFSAVKVIEGSASSYSETDLISEADKLKQFIKECYSRNDRFKGLVALRLCDGYGASQIMESESMSHHCRGRSEINGKILIGRRAEYDESINNLREKLYKNNPSIEVISYDRIVDVLKAMRRE